jgi:hypothetical protein
MRSALAETEYGALTGRCLRLRPRGSSACLRGKESVRFRSFGYIDYGNFLRFSLLKTGAGSGSSKRW